MKKGKYIIHRLYIFSIFLFSFQIATLKKETASLKAEREKVNSSMKDIIHGAEGYKVGLCGKEQDAIILNRRTDQTNCIFFNTQSVYSDCCQIYIHVFLHTV